MKPDLLLRIDPSPVVELNRDVAIAMRNGLGPGRGKSGTDGTLSIFRHRKSRTTPSVPSFTTFQKME
jgi:hypothetical protein